jgi:hypothetical protein
MHCPAGKPAAWPVAERMAFAADSAMNFCDWRGISDGQGIEVKTIVSQKAQRMRKNIGRRAFRQTPADDGRLIEL